MVETITVVLHTNDLSSMSGSYVKGSSSISSIVITTSYMAGISKTWILHLHTADVYQ